MKEFPTVNPYDGEMLPKERKTLFNWTYDNNISSVIETGTGPGGGGTFYIANALKQLGGDRKLYTCDPDRGPSDGFLKIYDNVQYMKMFSSKLIEHIIENNIDIDFIFFDGPEKPEVALEDIQKLETYIKSGTFFSMHDWCITRRRYDNHMSIKAELIRPYMEKSDKWELIDEMPDSMESVGLCLYRFK